MPSGLVFNIQKYSVHDGPGIRTTVFLKGCPLNCLWCHNPEGISSKQELAIVESRCLACLECRVACPHGAEIPGDGVLPARNAVCDLCGACVEACPTGGRQILGKEMTVEEILATVVRDEVFYQVSSGGVTFSGGEPLSQPEFLRALLEVCRARGLHTAVDTSGFAWQEHLLSIAPLVDLFLFDLKLMDDARHRECTGVSNALILENLQALGRAHRRIWLRVPVIPGCTDAEKDLEATARFASKIPSLEQVNLLPFHATGQLKSSRLGRETGLGSLEPPTQASMKCALDIFASFGLVVKIGG